MTIPPRVVANFVTGQVLNNLMVEGPVGAIAMVNGLDLTGMDIRFNSPSGPPLTWPANTPFWALGWVAESCYLTGTVNAGGQLVFAGCEFRSGGVTLDPQPVTLENGGPIIAPNHGLLPAGASGVVLTGGVGPGSGTTSALCVLGGSSIGGAPPLPLTSGGSATPAFQCWLGNAQNTGPQYIQSTLSLYGALPNAGIEVVAYDSSSPGPLAAGARSNFFAPSIGSNLGGNFRYRRAIIMVDLSAAAAFVLGFAISDNFEGIPVLSTTNGIWASGTAGAALAAGVYAFEVTDTTIVQLYGPTPAVLTKPPIANWVGLFIENVSAAAANEQGVVVFGS